MTDKKITCLQCGKEFTFTAGEQEWFLEQNLKEPKYCKECRQERKKARESQNQTNFNNVKEKAA